MAILGGGATLVLRHRQQLNTTVITFAISAVIAVETTQRLVGTTHGAPALFVWPVACAATLAGGLAGAGVLALCSVLIVLNLVIERASMYQPAFVGEAGLLVGTFDVVLALMLAAIVAMVTGGNLRRTLGDSEERAAKLAEANQRILAGQQREGSARTQRSQLAGGLMGSSTQQHEAARIAGSAVAETTTLVQQTSAAAQQMTLLASNVMKIGVQAKDAAQAGQAALTDDLSQLQGAVLTAEQVRDNARVMLKASHQMQQVLELLRRIADETHLLSLNATIEAAGAGLSGKRFAVVAHQVAELASQVSNGVLQAEGIVKGVELAANMTLTAGEQSLVQLRYSQQAISEVVVQLDQITAVVAQKVRVWSRR